MKRFHAIITTDAKPPYPVDLGIITGSGWHVAANRAVMRFMYTKGKGKQHTELRLTLRRMSDEPKDKD